MMENFVEVARLCYRALFFSKCPVWTGTGIEIDIRIKILVFSASYRLRYISLEFRNTCLSIINTVFKCYH